MRRRSGPISWRTRAQRRRSWPSRGRLRFEVVPALRNIVAAQPAHLVVVVAKPADRSGVGRITFRTEPLLACGLARSLAMQDLEPLLRRQHVFDVSEVNE